MARLNITCGEAQDLGWGILTQVTLPSGGKLGIYQPRHARPKAMKVARKKPSRKPRKKSSKTKARKRK
jgi:hypothetical protein